MELRQCRMVSYVIAAGTGAYANATGTGTVGATFVSGANRFVLLIHSA